MSSASKWPSTYVLILGFSQPGLRSVKSGVTGLKRGKRGPKSGFKLGLWGFRLPLIDLRPGIRSF